LAVLRLAVLRLPVLGWAVRGRWAVLGRWAVRGRWAVLGRWAGRLDHGCAHFDRRTVHYRAPSCRLLAMLSGAARVSAHRARAVQAQRGQFKPFICRASTPIPATSAMNISTDTRTTMSMKMSLVAAAFRRAARRAVRMAPWREGASGSGRVRHGVDRMTTWKGVRLHGGHAQRPELIRNQEVTIGVTSDPPVTLVAS
jgi:hypothetical protein